MRTRIIIGWSLGSALTIASPLAVASEEGPAAEPGSLDHTDHHHRPPQYNDPDLAVPPMSGAAAEYPLAAGFAEAHSSNFTNGGIVSYDFIVVHTMQGYYAGSISWFQNPDANVSAHYVMRSEDGEVTQMVRHADRAWHVGNSNPYALGIEHEGFIDDGSWYTFETYLSSARLTRWLCEQFDIPIDRDHIVGHVELPNQTHTDPGPLWDWDLYMALIRDVVPAGQVTGVVADRSRACTMTATSDTWIKATVQPSNVLDDTERCMIPAGTELTVLHAGDEMVGHSRVFFDAEGSPCAGPLAEQGFAWLDDFDATCDPATVAAIGTEVTLDGGETLPVDAQGRFTFEGIAPGPHTLEFAGADYLAADASVDVVVYPGARLVVGVDPIPSGGETGDETGDGDSGDDSPPGGTGGDSGAGDDLPGGETGADPDGTSGDDRALPPGFGESDGQGCGCRQRSAGFGGAIWLLPFMVFGVRRRRATGK